MNTKHKYLTVADITNNAKLVDDNGKVYDFVDGDIDNDGVIACDGKLNVRPVYQREFVWSNAMQKDFIASILKGWSVSPLVFSAGSTWECVDGQQRTITLCKFKNNELSIAHEGLRNVTYSNLSKQAREAFDNYVFQITFNDYKNSEEKIQHFRAINKPITVLTEQELRNAAYAGTFVTDLKHYFGKKNCCVAQTGILDKVVSKSIEIERQDLTELALFWYVVLTDDKVYSLVKDTPNHSIEIVPNELIDLRIRELMLEHKNDVSAKFIYDKFYDICVWALDTFYNFSKLSRNEKNQLISNLPNEFRNVKNWAYLYRTYANNDILNSLTDIEATELRKELADMLTSGEIHHKYNIPEYLLQKYSDTLPADEAERDLYLRKIFSYMAFPKEVKIVVFNKQGRVCNDCKRRFNVDPTKLDAHHIIPQSAGGLTLPDNCEVLCRECHGKRHNQKWENPYKELK